jgi:N-acetylglucosaminyldiphosphoundecaprenol N-acetyl-beta-D-mannosaminyltransferase
MTWDRPAVGPNLAIPPGGQSLAGRPYDFLMTRIFLGIRFWTGGVQELLRGADEAGGLFTVPSAPSLAQMRRDAALAAAYRASDWAVVDGGYVAVVLQLVFRRNFPRISGLQILQRLTGEVAEQVVPLQARRVLWVVPSEEERTRIDDYLNAQGFPAGNRAWYLAPFYRTEADFEDEALARQVAGFRPDWIVLCIGGGRQEKLGWYLRRQGMAASHEGVANPPADRANGPVILCTGGAIAFLTGGQASIPTWADRLYLGWLFRVCQSPYTFLPRYWHAGWEFPRLLWDHRNRLFEESGEGPGGG